MSPETIDESIQNQFRDVIEQASVDGLQNLVERNPEVRSLFGEPLFSFEAPAVVYAASRGNRELLRKLVDLGADLNDKSRWDAGAFGVLHHTCFHYPDLADELISWGATIDVHAAAGLGRIELLRQLNSEPKSVHKRGPDGQMPLSFSTSIEVADLLLASGADIDAVCVDHESTACQWLITTRKEVVRHLVNRGAAIDLFVAVALGSTDLVQRVLEEDPESVNARLGQDGYEPVRPGNIMDWSLGWQLAGGSSSPHAVAAHLGHTDVYELLMKASPEKTQFLVACWMGDQKLARKIKHQNPSLPADLEHRNARLLADAAWMGREAAVGLMLEVGFDPHVKGDHDSTPLNRAAFHGFDKIIQLLLAKDPDPPLEVQNEFGGTALGTLAYGSIHGWRTDGDYPAAAELLLQAGAKTWSEMADSARPDVATVLRSWLPGGISPASSRS